MKRFSLAAILILVVAFSARATSPLYYNNGTVTTPPVIDATNFVNEGRFEISTGLPFEFSSVQNFTNRNLMRNGFLDGFLVTGGIFSSFTSGFRFDTAPVNELAGWNRHPAKNFFNAPLVGNVASNATIYGDFQILVQATNIVNHGAIKVSEFGLVSLEGKTVDVSRSVLETGDFGVRTPTLPQGIFDDYWNFGTNNINPNNQFTLANPFTTPYTVISFPPPYFTNLISLNLAAFGTNLFDAREFISELDSNRAVQIVFVRNSDPDIHTRILNFGQQLGEPGSTVIEWSAYHTNIFGRIETNFLNLEDSYALAPTNRYITNYPSSPPPPANTAIPPRSFQPANFTVSRVEQLDLGFGSLGAAFTDKPASFWSAGGGIVTGAVYSAYGITVKTSLATEETAVKVRGAAGRVEVKADKNLSADLLQAEALTYLKLSATNHFSGSSNAYITAPFSDIALASTNGFLNMSSVLQPIVNRINGIVDIYSVRWTNSVFFNGTTNPVVFNVLMVDAFLNNTAPAQIFDASLKATNVEVGDTLNVLNNLSIDADRLNITSNGVITIGNNGIGWEASVPHLKTLTNSGVIFGLNTLSFISHNAGGTAKPMDAIVNLGSIQAAGITMTAHNLLNQGSIASVNGPLVLQINTNINLPLGGFLSAPEADINIVCRNLYVTNHSILAGRKLSLTVTNQLLAGTNDWQVYDGFSLPVKPTNSELGQVVLRSKAILNQEAFHLWSGSDRGAQGSGFINNAALGMLVLDGEVNSRFTFTGNGSPSNAIYLDRLELTNSAGLFDVSGNLKEVQINPGMVIYYAQATINGASAAEFLDGKNNGRLRWVSSHAGTFSGTNVIYPDGSTNFLNAALVSSCNLDSDNDGIPNCIDPSPVPLLTLARLNAKIVSNPNPMLSLSWLSVGWATNRVYTATNIKAPSWQFFTNIVSPPQAGPPFTLEYIVPLNSSRFYRVDIVAPPQ